MADKLLWGNARPLFRVGTNRYVLNQPPANIDVKWPKEVVLNQSLRGKYFEHILGYRGVFVITWDYLDRASCELLKTIVDSTSLYMRPHFNFWKEYQVRAVNGFELDRFGKVNQPYKGSLVFQTVELETDIPNESSGGMICNVNTKIEKSISLTDDISVEIWIKTPETIATAGNFIQLDGTGFNSL